MCHIPAILMWYAKSRNEKESYVERIFFTREYDDIFLAPQNVVDAMRAALSAEFKAAIPTYDDRPRTKWLTENSVQNTMVVSRLIFTADINAAFDDMEDGNEDALKVCNASHMQEQLVKIPAHLNNVFYTSCTALL